MSRLSRFFGDDRGVGFQILMVLLFLAAVSLTISILLEPTQEVRDHGEKQINGTEYEQYGDTTRQRAWDAFVALPMIALVLGLVFVVVMAILLSA